MKNDITIPTTWVSVNALTGIPIGQPLNIINKGLHEIAVKDSLTQPLTSDINGFPVLSLPKGNNFVHIRRDLLEIWARSITNLGTTIQVTSQDFNVTDTGIDPRIYGGNQAITVQPFTEVNVKRGTQFEGSTLLLNVGGGSSNDTIFLTGTQPVILKVRRVGYSGTGVSAFIYNSPSYTGGTPAAYQNANNINPAVGESTIIVGSTVSSDGVLAFAPVHTLGNTSNQGKGSAISTIAVEHILVPNTPYLLRLTSLDSQSQDITSYISWYEGPLSTPL